MQLPDNIEKKLRETARKRGYSEVEYLHYREFVINLALSLKATLEHQNSLKKAA